MLRSCSALLWQYCPFSAKTDLSTAATSVFFSSAVLVENVNRALLYHAPQMEQQRLALLFENAILAFAHCCIMQQKARPTLYLYLYTGRETLPLQHFASVIARAYTTRKGKRANSAGEKTNTNSPDYHKTHHILRRRNKKKKSCPAFATTKVSHILPFLAGFDSSPREQKNACPKPPETLTEAQARGCTGAGLLLCNEYVGPSQPSHKNERHVTRAPLFAVLRATPATRILTGRQTYTGIVKSVRSVCPPPLSLPPALPA